MKVESAVSLYIFFFIQEQFIVKIQAGTCYYYGVNSTVTSTTCDDDCCSLVASSIQTACCSSISLSSLAIPFFVIAGICFLGICLIYCRPLWKAFLCGYKCPCGNRTRISAPNTSLVNDNPVFVINNDGLPDYDTIIKDPSTKDPTPPAYHFVTTHPNDFGIEGPIPSAPPQYPSRRSSIATINLDAPAEP